MNTHCYDNVSVRAMLLRDQVYSPNVGQMLTVVQISYGKVPAEDVLSGEAEARTAYLSSDGRAWLAEWHREQDGKEDCELVYVERHDLTGCVFHGWVDPVSRRIVQAG